MGSSILKGLIEIRERQNSYGLLVAILLIIIMVLISYIAYSKGLEKTKEKNTTTTTKVSDQKINKQYTYDEICNQETECNKEIADLNNLKIKLESVKEDNLIIHNLIFSGKIDKTISLKRFVSLQIIESSFYLIEETLNEETENNTLTLYNEVLSKLDKIELNNLIDKSTDGLEITYYTYDESCEEENNKYFIKNRALITSDGFNLTGSSQGPLKEDGFVC